MVDNGAITDKAEYGQHIALFCINHPGVRRWSTKNIYPIGCRTIFYNLNGDPYAPPECDCPVSALRPL